MLGKERKSTAVLPCSKFPGMHAHQQLVCNIASVQNGRHFITAGVDGTVHILHVAVETEGGIW